MVLKPSEKVPFTMTKIVELLKEAGLPDGVVNLVHGTADGVFLFLTALTSLSMMQPFLFLFHRALMFVVLNSLTPFFIFSRQCTHRP